MSNSQPFDFRWAGASPPRIIPIARSKFMNCSLLQVPPASRGEPSRASTRFPLRAGGTLGRGFQSRLFS
jgi:hypothetical protein